MLTADKGTHNFSYCQILLKKSVDFLAIPYIYCTFAVMLDAESSHLLETTPVVPDDVHWYPMRVTYQRVKAIKTLLDADHVENFLPMHWVWQEKKDGQRELNHRPLIASMIFVRDTRDHIIKLKQLPGYEPLRFYTRPSQTLKDRREIFPIPDKQMADFIRVSSSGDERVVFLEDTDYLRSVGQRVRVAEGKFAGVEGVVKRIKNNKCVVVRLEGIAAVAILRFPVHSLIKL
jgi:transcription antitermination factor NusG